MVNKLNIVLSCLVDVGLLDGDNAEFDVMFYCDIDGIN
ncbi:hypothetical protein SALWKB12_1642 [Snodgrassella communis]|nr:hypothetical protein SALWKB12_1642 [Snodgrassella communis]